MKSQEDYPTAKNYGKERLRDYSTSVALQYNRCRVV